MQDKKYVVREINKLNHILKRSCGISDIKAQIDNVTGSNGWIIGFLAENRDTDIFQRDIEEKFSIRRSTVSNIIQLMEKKDLIRRESVDYDARLKKLVLTERAMEIHSIMDRHIEEQDKLLKKGISDEELEAFFGVIEKIKKNAV